MGRGVLVGVLVGIFLRSTKVKYRHLTYIFMLPLFVGVLVGDSISQFSQTAKVKPTDLQKIFFWILMLPLCVFFANKYF